MIDIAGESSDTGTRTAAQRLRQAVLAQLSENPGLVTLDFAKVSSASSSYLDELLGRLARQLGRKTFREKIQIIGMSELVERMANVVVDQRLGDLNILGNEL